MIFVLCFETIVKSSENNIYIYIFLYISIAICSVISLCLEHQCWLTSSSYEVQAHPNNFSFVISQTASWEACSPNQMIHVFKLRKYRRLWNCPLTRILLNTSFQTPKFCSHQEKALCSALLSASGLSVFVIHLFPFSSTSLTTVLL